MQSLKFKPATYYRLDDTSPFQDYSGYAQAASITGTESHGIALTSNALYSQRFSSTNYATLVAPIYVKGREKASFSMTATVYPVTIGGTGEQQVSSHGNNYDGLSINGSVVSFSTKYVNSGTAKCSYDVQTIKKLDIVGTHTATKNSLFINGVLVSEVDITEAQIADSFDITDTNFYSGKTSSSQKILVNGLGFYPRALQTEEVSSLYLGNSKRALGSVPKMFGGADILVSTAVRPLFLDTGWFENIDWLAASLNNVVADGGQLHASMVDGLTVAGTWMDSVDLYSGLDPINIHSVNLWWEGKNETVEVSIDGDNWTPAVKGQNLSIIPTNFNPTGKALYLKASFPAGMNEAYIDFIRVNGYTSNTAVSNNRVLTYNNPVVPLDEYPPFELRNDWGAIVGASGTIAIGTDPSDVVTPIRTIEIWVKPDTSASTTVGGATTATYVNGISSNTLVPGEWQVYHRVLASDQTGGLSITLTGIIGKIAIYDTALSAAQILSIVSNYTGIDKIKYDGTGSINISEPAASTTIYAHDWSIQSS